MNMSSELQEILLLAAKDRPSKYHELLKKIFEIPRSDLVKNIKEYLEHAIQDQLGLVISRQLFQDFIDMIRPLVGDLSCEASLDILNYALSLLQQRAVAFEEQISDIRLMLADIYESQEDWSGAATALKGIPIDSGTRSVSGEFKAKLFIRIVRLYLEEQDSVNADAFLNRAQLLDITDRRLQVELIACYARSCDFKRQFLNAAQKYLELSHIVEMDETERVQALICAIICSVLAPAGPQRTRLLATLYKDDRSRESIDVQSNGVGAILEKMHLGRICKPAHVKEFRNILQPHQLALLPDGSTVLDRAMREHNILSVSKVYNNISFEELGILLALNSIEAESLIAKMIGESRLNAKIDQVENLVYFSKKSELENWDAHIGGFCHHLDDIAVQIRQKYPNWKPTEF